MESKQTCFGDCDSCYSNKNEIIAGSGYETKNILDKSRSKHSFQKGELIYKQGLFPQGVFCLKKGSVMVTQSDLLGNTFIVHLYKEVQFLGLASFFSSNAYATNCIALEPCDLCFFPMEIFNQLISSHKDFAQQILSTLSMQFIEANNRTLALTKKNMRARIADALIEMYNVFGVNKYNELNGYLKRSEIGMFASVSEANVIRALSEFQKEGTITINGKSIQINRLNDLIAESNR